MPVAEDWRYDLIQNERTSWAAGFPVVISGTTAAYLLTRQGAGCQTSNGVSRNDPGKICRNGAGRCLPQWRIERNVEIQFRVIQVQVTICFESSLTLQFAV
jgi:hypothetical protein